MSGTTHPSTDGEATGRAEAPEGTSEGAPIANSRCVLWLHPNEVVPKPLLKSLSRRIERTIFATDSFQALAEVLALGQEGRRDGRACPIVLLLIKPLRLNDADQVLRSLDMYAPRTRRWRFDPSAKPVFAPMSEEDVARLSSQTRNGADSSAAAGGQIVVSPNAGEGLGLVRDRPTPVPSQPRPIGFGGSRSGSPGSSHRRSESPADSDRARPLPKPRLRLVEADSMAETMIGAPIDDARGSHRGSATSRPGSPSDSAFPPGPGSSDPAGKSGRTSFSQLTQEEMNMLLSDSPAAAPSGPSPSARPPSNPPPSRLQPPSPPASPPNGPGSSGTDRPRR